MEAEIKTIGNFILSNDVKNLKLFLKEYKIDLNDVFFTLNFNQKKIILDDYGDDEAEINLIYILNPLNTEVILKVEEGYQFVKNLKWTPLFLALFSVCSTEMAIFIIESTNNLHYKDENGSKIPELLNMCTKSTNMISRLFRKYVDVNITDKWIIEKEYHGNLYHFHYKYISKDNILDLDLKILLDLWRSIKEDFWVKDENSFYYFNYYQTIVKYESNQNKVIEVCPYKDFERYYDGKFYFYKTNDGFDVFDIEKQEFFTYEEPYNGIFPHKDFLFIPFVFQNKLTISQFKNNQLLQKISHQVKDIKMRSFFHDYLIVRNKFLIFAVSENVIHIYYFSNKSLKFVNEIQAKTKLETRSSIQKISDELIVTSFNDELTFWDLAENGDKLMMIEKYKITVPTTQWSQIKRIEYNINTHILIVVDKKNYSFLYKQNNHVNTNFDGVFSLKDIFFKFQNK